MMHIPFFSLERQTKALKAELDKAAQDVFESNQFVSGEFAKRFEEDFAKYLGALYCISCGNATDGLELVLRALGIGLGDEVIVPAFTWISDAEAVSLVGAKPVFVEVDQRTMNISPDGLRDLITQNTRAVIFTHLFGGTAGFQEVKAITEEFELKLIEDCAQAHGAVIDDKKVGTLSNAGVFSFYPTKNLGAYGDGGAVVTRDPALAERIRLLANHGQSQRDNHVIEGRNSRMDELQAAYLTVKLPFLDLWNKRRREIAGLYRSGLQGELMVTPELDGDHVYHQFVIRTEERDALKKELLKVGIQTAIHYPRALPFLKPYRVSTHNSTFEISRDISNQVLSLPIWPELKNEEVEFVIGSINSYLH